MKFAIGIPQIYPDGAFSPPDFRSYLARVEELGVYESAWTQEAVLGFSPQGAAPQLAPLELMTYAAACTSTLRLGCTVLVTTLHNPVHLAKGLATLDQLSGGRLEIGVGSGGPGRAIESAAVTGTVAECVDGVQAVIDAGAQMILFTPLYDVNEHMELIADLIIPAVLSREPKARGGLRWCGITRRRLLLLLLQRSRPFSAAAAGRAAASRAGTAPGTQGRRR